MPFNVKSVFFFLLVPLTSSPQAPFIGQILIYSTPPPIMSNLRYALPTPLLSFTTSNLSTSEAVVELLKNSVSALDQVYFGSSSSLREDNNWRSSTLTTRIKLPSVGGGKKGPLKLVITDLGIGLTRSDILNVLCFGTDDCPSGGGFWKSARMNMVNRVVVETRNVHDEGYKVTWEKGEVKEG